MDAQALFACLQKYGPVLLGGGGHERCWGESGSRWLGELGKVRSGRALSAELGNLDFILRVRRSH